MTLLKKILNLFGRNTEINSIKDYKSDSKSPFLTTEYKPMFLTDEYESITEDSAKLSPNRELAPSKADKFKVIVVGVFFYQMALEKICGGRREEGIELHIQAKIIPDDDNPDDAHAVKIEIEGETVGHLSRKKALIWRGKMISEGFSGAVECPAKIAWDRKFDKAGSYGVWLDVDLTLPDSQPERHSANNNLVPNNQSEYIEFLINELNRFELLNCKVGDEVSLWQKGNSKEILIYRQGADFGQGKIGICPDSVCDVLLAAAGWDASIANIYEDGCKISCKLISKAEMAERLKPFKAAERKRRQDMRRDLATPIEYSFIDSDIYRCFIANKSGLCEYIGTYEQFAKIEESIARLCQEKNGKYYKTKAKTAKFAIIFNPNERSYSNVMYLKGKGYKVTTWEKALEYFGLTDLWDCKKHAQHEYDLKKFNRVIVKSCVWNN